MPESPHAADAGTPADRVRAVLETAWAGAVVFGVLAAVEAAICAWRFDGPQPLGDLRRNVLASLALGAAAGGAWGLLCEGPLGRRPVRRRVLHPPALVVLFAAFALVVHTQRHALPPGAPVGGTLSLAMLFGHAVATVLLLATLRAVARCAPHERGRLVARPLRPAAAAVVLGLGALALPDALVPDAPRDGPDVLLVVLDTTRADRFPPVPEGARPIVPSYEALARDGVVFAQARSASPWTLPGHASLFTGALPSEHGATSEHPHLDGRLPTLAERLAARGLHTVAFARKGWLNRQTGVLRGFVQSFDFLDPAPRPAALELWHRLFEPAEPDDAGGAWIARAAGTWFLAHPDAPRFAFLNFDEAHSPLRPPEPYRSAALGARAGTPWGREKVPHAQRFNTGLDSYDAQDLADIARLYDAELMYQDDLLGGVLRALDASGRLDDTLVIVTADHGEHLGEHGLLGHDFSLYDEVLRVPLVLRFPQALPRGLVIDAPVETRRLGALIDAVRAREPGAPPLDADEITALLTGPLPEAAAAAGGEAAMGPAIVSELYRPPFGTPAWAEYPRTERFDRRLKSLMVGGLKYVWGSDDRDALLAPLADPGETEDLLASRPEAAAALRAALRADPRLWPVERGAAPALDADLEEHLRQTGYLR